MKKILITRKLIKDSEDKALKTFEAKLNSNDELYSKSKFYPQYISKIELPSSVPHLKEIVQESDGVMVARGDLGVQLPIEKVPAIQKKIIKEANIQGKPVITATQMLESMIESASPTRAEATDIHNLSLIHI